MNEYRDKLQHEMIQALFKVGLEAGAMSGAEPTADGRQNAIFDSKAITEVCVTMIATMVHTSTVVSTPSGKRAFCDQLARSIQRQISDAQRNPEMQTMFANTIHVGTVQ